MLKIELTKHGYLLFDSSAVSQFPGFNVEMTFGSDLPVKETMRKLVVSHIPSSQDSIDMILSSPSIQKIGRAAIQGKIVINSSPSENTSGAGYEPYFFFFKQWEKISPSFSKFLRTEVRGDFNIHGTKYFKNAVFQPKVEEAYNII